jgi:hypothetical protein
MGENGLNGTIPTELELLTGLAALALFDGTISVDHSDSTGHILTTSCQWQSTLNCMC